ncbi:MAG TPA: alkaline phosphatase family protein [Mycobacteriales bacterium]|nr:alkaline phosphatase family protein [Mycobacteriales bacterium]
MASVTSGRIGPAYRTTPYGRVLHPAGRMTKVGDFPSGGALSPDGRFYWAVDSGHGRDDVNVVSVASGRVVQVLPLPGAYGGIAFSPNGQHAYVSGEPQGSSVPTGPVKAATGDAIHVFSVDPHTGHAKETTPLTLPTTSGGTAQKEGANPASFILQPPGPGPSSGLGWPIGLAVTPDGRTLVVALNQADQAVVIDLLTHATTLVKVGRYPFGVAADARHAYVSNEYDGTISVIDLTTDSVVSTISVGGLAGDLNAHPEGVALDAARHRLFVAVTNRDAVAVVDTDVDTLNRTISVARPGGIGSAPVALAVTPDGRTVYVADAGEDAVAAIALRPRSGVRTDTVVGRVPTAAYPSGVAVTPDGRRLVWLAAKGLGSGPNPDSGEHFADSEAAPYGQYDPDMLLGRVGVLRAPSDSQLRAMASIVNREVRPANFTPPPLDTPIESPGGGPSAQIKHVFYIVKENRTYDQVFGSDPRGDGDPALELFDDNGARGPAGGVTPNAHRLARMFPLLDHFYADSEVSVDGHLITSGGYATDYVERALQANYASRGRIANFGQDPVTFPPNDFIFDQAVRQGISFRNYGEYNAGATPQADDGRPTYATSQDNFVLGYPLFFGCDNAGIAPPDGVNNAAVCDTDSGTLGAAGAADTSNSRFDFFQADFERELATGSVPALNYITLPNDHTNGVQKNYPTPRALVADNDLGLGQFVDLISHSSIWSSSAIFVVEDDSQDGADHVDAHRMPAFVISPWARHGVVMHTRYDQLSVLRTIELILGLHPLSLYDGLAEPMYDVFIPSHNKPDLTAYDAVTPAQSLTQLNTSEPTGIDAVLPYNEVDLVPQSLFDAALYRSVYGADFQVPPPGPDASPVEADRAAQTLAVWRRHGDVAAFLRAHPLGDADAG